MNNRLKLIQNTGSITILLRLCEEAPLGRRGNPVFGKISESKLLEAPRSGLLRRKRSSQRRTIFTNVLNKFLYIIQTFLCWLCLTLFSAYHCHGIALIRDAELENIIQQLADPLIKTSGIDPMRIHLYLVNDPEINAYVAGGMNMFINSGLLVNMNDPELISGVIAHELGHITSMHLIKTSQKMRELSNNVIGSSILGLASLAATGNPFIAIALITGGSHVSEREALGYSRENEQQADSAALKFLSKSNQSPQALYGALKFLSRHHNLSALDVNPYLITHPLSQERLGFVAEQIKHIPTQTSYAAGVIRIKFALALAKLKAFLNPPDQTLIQYSNHTQTSLYAQAIAHFRLSNLPKSLASINQLIAQSPKNAYFHELKGQILFETGNIQEALLSYTTAEQLLPHPLIKLGLALTKINLCNGPSAQLTSAIKLLKQTIAVEPANLLALKLLASAYGKNQELGMSYLTMAISASISQNKKEVLKYAKLAMQHLPKNSSSRIHAQDLLYSYEGK